MDINFKIFVEDEIIYYGNFSELPQEHREKMVEALDEWGELLGKSGLNETIFSFLALCKQKQYECPECGKTGNKITTCPDCGDKIIQKDTSPQNEKISTLLNCIGMITHLEVERP